MTAQYVELIPTDNFFGISPPGGDRVGLGEVAFQVVPEAGESVLACLGLTGLLAGRRRRRKATA